MRRIHMARSVTQRVGIDAVAHRNLLHAAGLNAPGGLGHFLALQLTPGLGEGTKAAHGTHRIQDRVLARPPSGQRNLERIRTRTGEGHADLDHLRLGRREGDLIGHHRSVLDLARHRGAASRQEKLKAAKEGTSMRRKSIATGILVSKLAALYIKYYEKFLISKEGGFRKHVYGARSNFTFRTVITASTGRHKHNEVVPPWVISVTTFRPHLLNKLIRRGYSYKQADRLLNHSIGHYSSVIEELQKELISESPYPQGIPVIVNRNPSLLQSSALMCFIPGFNTNPDIQATTLSPLIAKLPNADYDQMLSAR